MPTGRRAYSFPPAEKQYYVRSVLTAAQVNGIFATPLTILPGQAGFYILPTRLHVFKDAGAYGVAAVTALQISSGAIAINSIAGFFDQAGALTSLAIAPGSGLAAFLGTAGVINPVIGADMTVRTTGAALTGNGGPLTITVVYELIPLIFPWS